VASNHGGAGIAASAVDISCSDLFGNEGGDWIGELAFELGVNGNICADPIFCDAENGDLSIRDDSPCAPGHNPDCILTGALPVGCLVAGADEWVDAGATLSIGPCVPNPFRGSTVIRFRVPGDDAAGTAAPVRLAIYDVAGRQVRELLRDVPGAGEYDAVWDGRDDAGGTVGAGAYFCRITRGAEVRTARLVSIR
jgi:hypothetical protein